MHMAVSVCLDGGFELSNVAKTVIKHGFTYVLVDEFLKSNCAGFCDCGKLSGVYEDAKTVKYHLCCERSICLHSQVRNGHQSASEVVTCRACSHNP